MLQHYGAYLADCDAWFKHTQKSLAKDFDPKEIVNSGIFSLKGAQQSMRKLAAGDLSSFGQDLLEALVPPPEKLGAVMAVSRVSIILLFLYGISNKYSLTHVIALMV